MKVIHSIGFFALLLVAVIGAFLLLSANRNQEPPTLAKEVTCGENVIQGSILQLDANTTLIGAFITFESLPLSDQVNQELEALGVTIDLGSQIFEVAPHVLAQIPTASICDLAKIDVVKSIFIPEVAS